jgi:PncC family amidohydrolase
MEGNQTNKVVFSESYSLYGISIGETLRLTREKLPDYRDIRTTVSDDTGDIIVDFYSEEEDQKHFNRTLKAFKKVFQEYIMTPPNTTLEQVFFQMMSEKKYHVSTAESCTGGMLSARIINVSGSSSIIEEAFITYSEDAKMKVLGIQEKTLKKYGVTSIECAGEMARCLKKLTDCELCVSITGIAGPAGGTEETPVGTVCFGICFHDACLTFKEWFPGDRLSVRKKAVSFALSESIFLLKNENKN